MKESHKFKKNPNNSPKKKKQTDQSENNQSGFSHSFHKGELIVASVAKRIGVKKIFFGFFFLNILALLIVIHLSSLLSADTIHNPENVQGAKSEAYPLLVEKGSDLDISSLSYIIYDPDSRVVIAEKNSHFRFAPASTAKIATALVALNTYKLSDVFQADEISIVVGSKMGLYEGEKMTVQNLLYGLLLPSGNDAAFVLAKHYSTGYVGFVGEMNTLVADLHLENTHFIDPAGIDDRNYTTAQDLARLASYAMKNQEFRKVVGTKEIQVSDIEGKTVHKLTNLNEMLQIPGVTGVKTGFTEEAGGVLTTSAVVKGKEFIIVVLKSQDRFFDTKKIMQDLLDKVELEYY